MSENPRPRPGKFEELLPGSQPPPAHPKRPVGKAGHPPQPSRRPSAKPKPPRGHPIPPKPQKPTSAQVAAWSWASKSKPAPKPTGKAPTIPDTAQTAGGNTLTHTRNLPVGTRLQAGRYCVGRVLGEGGFAIAYRGAHRDLRQSVAIKELFPANAMRQGITVSMPADQRADFDQAKARALEEARILSSLNSPNIVNVSDLFSENGTAYIVMEYLDGQTLQDRIDEQGALHPDTVIEVAVAVCNALTTVHDRDILHRDIKPSNIVMASDGRIVLIDFGSARSFATDQTIKHTRIVSADYAAPEMFGDAARFGPPADIHCLGATLYHALTGHPPPSVMDRLQGAIPAIPATTPPGLASAIRQALQIEVAKRPGTANEIRAICLGPTNQKEAPTADLPVQPQIRGSGGCPAICHILINAKSILNHIDFSRDGTLFAYGKFNTDKGAASITIYDMVARTPRQNFRGVASPRLDNLWFADDGQTLGGTHDDYSKIHMWSTSTGTLQHSLEVKDPAIQTDTAVLALANTLLAIKSGRHPPTQQATATGHLGRNIRLMASSCDWDLLATVEHQYPWERKGSTMHLWDVATGDLCWISSQVPCKIRHIQFSPDNRTLAITGRDKITHLWDVDQNRLRHTIRGDKSTPLGACVFTSTHTLAVVGQKGGKLHVSLWNTDTGGILHVIKSDHTQGFHMATCTCSPVPALAIGASDCADVSIWDVNTGRLLGKITGNRFGVHHMKFSLDGQKLACVCGNGSIRIWDTASLCG